MKITFQEGDAKVEVVLPYNAVDKFETLMEKWKGVCDYYMQADVESIAL